MTRERPPAARLVLAAVLLLACDGDLPRPADVPVSIRLADYLAVAGTRGPVDPLEDPGAASSGGIRMAAGSRMTFHFALPEDAALVGEGRASDPGGDPRGIRVRVAVTPEGGAPARVFENPVVESAGVAGVSIREDLSAYSGKMARVSISFESTGAPEAREAHLDWRVLRIEGTRAEPREPQFARDHYNVFLVVLDSLRQDHVEPYGATEVQTPSLTRLADAGVTFANARANASWTSPAVASLLTSLYPPSHGIRLLEDPLAGSVPYLPEILRRHGYETLAVSYNPIVSPDFGWDRGFRRMSGFWDLGEASGQHHDDPESRARFVWSRAIRATVRGEEPFFVYLHEIDPHSPYEPPDPYRSQYAIDYRGNATSTNAGLTMMRRWPDRVTPDDVLHINARYKGEVSYMDRYVGWMLDRLESVQLEHPTLFVFASDHGEEFWEHRSVGHGHTVYEELLRIPLLMKLDGVLPAGRRVRAAVSLADVTPTILDLLGIAIPESMQGESLLPLIAAADDDHLRRASIASASGERALESISFGRWKLIRHADSDPPRLALYDLASDPGEHRDRAEDRPVVTATLEQLLRWHHHRRPPEPTTAESKVAPGELDPEIVRSLRELGYLE